MKPLTLRVDVSPLHDDTEEVIAQPRARGNHEVASVHDAEPEPDTESAGFSSEDLDSAAPEPTEELNVTGWLLLQRADFW